MKKGVGIEKEVYSAMKGQHNRFFWRWNFSLLRYCTIVVKDAMSGESEQQAA